MNFAEKDYSKIGFNLIFSLGHDNEMKYDNLNRSLSMMEDELKRAEERVKNAEAKVVVIEDELAAIGENQKQLEVSEEKARKREEKYQVCLILQYQAFEQIVKY